MAALTADRMTASREAYTRSHPVAAGVQIFAGAMVALNAAGFAVPASTATGLKVVGRALERVDNRNGAAGDQDVSTDNGTFRFANHDTDTVNRTHIGSDAWVVDDQTVAASNGGNTRSVAGEIFDVDANGVWIKI